MRVCPLLTRFTFIFLALQFCALTAFATSVGKSSSTSVVPCRVTGKFIGTNSKDGKIRWIFDQITVQQTPQCAGLPRNFSIFIPSGSFSTLSKSNVYPISITEPDRGAEVDLQIEKISTLGWLLSGDDPLKVKR